MEILILENVSREAPPIRPLDNEIESLFHLAIQPPHVLCLIRLGQSLRGPLHGDHVLWRNDFRIVTDPRGGILEQAVQDGLLRAELVTDSQLIVPGLGVLPVVRSQLFGHCAASLLDLEAPVQLRSRVGLEVYARNERRVQALFQAFLVEEEGVLEGVERSCQEGRPCEDEAGADIIRVRRSRRGSRRRSVGNRCLDFRRRSCRVEPGRCCLGCGCASGAERGGSCACDSWSVS